MYIQRTAGIVSVVTKEGKCWPGIRFGDRKVKVWMLLFGHMLSAHGFRGF